MSYKSTFVLLLLAYEKAMTKIKDHNTNQTSLITFPKNP
jgi:hypothetical protein